MNKLVIFDFDGTIADSFRLAIESYQRLHIRLGLEALAEDQFEHFRDHNVRHILKELGVPLVKLPFLMRTARKTFYEHIHQIPLQHGLKDVLYTLNSACRLGIVTSNASKNVNHFLRLHELELFEFVKAGGIHALFGKHVVIKKLLINTSISHRDAIYIGDEVRDIEAARKSGLQVIAVTWGYNSKKALKQENPDYLVDNPQQLLSILENWL